MLELVAQPFSVVGLVAALVLRADVIVAEHVAGVLNRDVRWGTGSTSRRPRSTAPACSGRSSSHLVVLAYEMGMKPLGHGKELQKAWQHCSTLHHTPS